MILIIITNIFMKILFWFLLFFYLLHTSFWYNCETSPNKESIKIVSDKILVLSQKYNISVSNISNKILKVLEKINISEKQKCIIYKSIEELTQNQKTKKEKILSYNMYNSYKNTYLQKIDEKVLDFFIFEKQNSENRVYLTFDDGPNGKKLTDFLEKNNIAATFFFVCNKMNSKNIKHYQKNIFSIWAHTYSHKNYDNLSFGELEKDVEKCKNVFQKLDLKFDIFRPAYWIINENEMKVAQKNNLKVYIWNIDSLDWNNGFNQKRIENITKNIKSWDIILFHENVNIDNLSSLIKAIQKRWFSFGKL